MCFATAFIYLFIETPTLDDSRLIFSLTILCHRISHPCSAASAEIAVFYWTILKGFAVTYSWPDKHARQLTTVGNVDLSNAL